MPGWLGVPDHVSWTWERLSVICLVRGAGGPRTWAVCVAFPPHSSPCPTDTHMKFTTKVMTRVKLVSGSFSGFRSLRALQVPCWRWEGVICKRLHSSQGKTRPNACLPHHPAPFGSLKEILRNLDGMSEPPCRGSWRPWRSMWRLSWLWGYLPPKRTVQFP